MLGVGGRPGGHMSQMKANEMWIVSFLVIKLPVDLMIQLLLFDFVLILHEYSSLRLQLPRHT